MNPANYGQWLYRRVIIPLVLAFALAGCGRGPDFELYGPKGEIQTEGKVPVGIRVKNPPPPPDGLRFRWRAARGRCEPQESDKLSSTYTAPPEPGDDRVIAEVFHGSKSIFSGELSVKVVKGLTPEPQVANGPAAKGGKKLPTELPELPRGGGEFYSPDNHYRVVTITDDSGVHYQIHDLKTKRVILKTHARYKTPNDVKAGAFSPDGSQFAAAYHYGHTGDTWVGVWSVPDGRFVRSETIPGHTTELQGIWPQQVASQIAQTLTIEVPREGEMIRTAVYDDMSGVYEGELPSGYRLWVLAQDRHNFFLMDPPPDVRPVQRRWKQRNVRLATPGRWELHVCTANEAASRWLEERARRNDWSGFPSLPDGMAIIRSVNIERSSATSGRLTIRITQFPSFDPIGGPDSSADIAGEVSGVDPNDVRVVVFARTDYWYVQPLVAAPFTRVEQDGKWSTWTHTGREYAALLVRPSYDPPARIPALPPEGGDVLAVIKVKGKGNRSALGNSGHYARPQQVALQIAQTLSIEAPKEGDIIGTGVYHEMRGTYEGQLPSGYKLRVVAKDTYGHHFLMSPLTQVMPGQKRWSQTNVRLGNPGRWELDVCVANEAALQWTEGEARSLLPKSMAIVRSVTVERR